MFAGSRFCARCGAEATRELIEEAAPLPCPRCREPMQALRLADTMARECPACGGLWLNPAALQRLSDAHESHADVVTALGLRVPTAKTPPDVVRYVPCPECGCLMNRKGFGAVLDICARHGIWLDRGELERVLGYVSGGGLARSRAREQERLIEEQRRLIALQKSPPGHGMGGELGAFAQHDATWSRTASGPADQSLARFLFDVFKTVVSE